MQGEDIRRLLIDQRILRGSQRPPAAAGCDKLALLVTELQASWFSWVLSDLTKDDVRAQQISSALDTLSELLPATRRELTNDHMTEDVVILDRLADATEVAQTRSWASCPGPRVHRWHQYAGQLADTFLEAMRSTNPDLEIGYSNRGPLPRFLQAVIPMIGNEGPTGTAVVRYLTRQRQRPARG